MKNDPTSIRKSRDVATGCFFWILYFNIYFIILLKYRIAGPDQITLFLGLPSIVVPTIFFAKKRAWIGVGILTAILISAGSWTALYLIRGGLPTDSFQETLEVILEILFTPFPAGLLLFMT